MLELLIRCLVVFCDLYIVLWVIGFFAGLFRATWRWSLYPLGPNLPGSVVSLLVAITVAIVGRAYGIV